MLNLKEEITCPKMWDDISLGLRVRILEDCTNNNGVCINCPQRIDIIRTIIKRRAEKISTSEC
mgnify:FL=1